MTEEEPELEVKFLPVSHATPSVTQLEYQLMRQ